jgi:DNA-binding transcriptional ArsR family regulator
MPLYTPGQRDPLTEITRFQVSPVLEMLQSLQLLMDPVRRRNWREQVAELLGTAFTEKLKSLYVNFHGGGDFYEFPIGMGLIEDIPGFLEEFSRLSPSRFLYYALGRVYPEKDLPAEISAASVEGFLEDRGTRTHRQHAGARFDWCDLIEETRDEIHDLWSNYYRNVFLREVDTSNDEYGRSIAEQEYILRNEGGTALLRFITGMSRLPHQIPAGMPYHEIVFVPVQFSVRRHTMYYGYGNVTVIYDVRISREKAAEEEKERRRLVALHRALGDSVRLGILRIIATDDYKFNGQRIAEWIGLSPSVVSRHLRQLREAGLIEEHSPDNRNTLYRLRPEAVERISGDLLTFLKEL